jgi:hypothetical protein
MVPKRERAGIEEGTQFRLGDIARAAARERAEAEARRRAAQARFDLLQQP